MSKNSNGSPGKESARTTMPGLRGIDHIGITVPSIDEAVDFFVNVLGCEPFYELGPFVFADDWMSRQLNVAPQTTMRKLKFLRCGNGSNIELFEYEAVDQKTIPPLNSDVGGHHLAFYVDDFDAALIFLQERGVKILGEPVERTVGPSAGQTWIYFLAPWGLQCELVSFPRGKGYERETERRLWSTCDPSL
ncbi:glyoxalase [Ensifer sp. NM-2]|uniref:VOC family protein n=1 Tax=Ensifer sp. NM-2 TaxID=2109730 RepID=UPI000D117492|nr:VOC family protein [Ensifer sp. NM-2]PSS60535.1 glyoxalase [Ensifer sp. NM-2]